MISLNDSVNVLPNVGKKRFKALNALNIYNIKDLLFYFPNKYKDMELTNKKNIKLNSRVLFKGKICKISIVGFGSIKRNVLIKFLVDNTYMNVLFFNQLWLLHLYHVNDSVIFEAKYYNSFQNMIGIKIYSLEKFSNSDCYPIYKVNKNISQTTIIKLIKLAYNKYYSLLKNIVPKDIRYSYNLMNLRDTVYYIHFAKSKKQLKLAYKSEIFREFFIFELKLQYIKLSLKNNKCTIINYDLNRLKKFIHELPFNLTNSQKKCVNEICHDMHSNVSMNRLLQGDVGSGKTIVAAISMFAATTAGYQSVLMVPTSVLAEQHFIKFNKLFEKEKIKICLLTSKIKKSDKKKLLNDIANGEYNIVIGTHALIQENISFKKLGFVVIDEQHRFGVVQRNKLYNKGVYPDVLMMTATPIPRTLAITDYGSMDISILNEMPLGRIPVTTIYINHKQFRNELNLINEQLKLKHQIFVITPLIEESSKLDLHNANEIYEKMKLYFNEYNVALLHSKMKEENKETIMNDFINNKIQILVSTTVVEVGVDVSNATVMIIYNADRFGLSQLHQLRGRVGRSNIHSYCILISDSKNLLSQKRMELMTKINDGFLLSEKDLEIRGTGDIFGYRQSGHSGFKIANPIKQSKILFLAYKNVKKILKNDCQLRKPENKNLYEYLQKNLTKNILN